MRIPIRNHKGRRFAWLPIKLLLVCSVAMLSLASRVDAAVWVSGQVVGAKTRTAVAGATVSLSTPGGTTTMATALGNGSFLLKAPRPGHYALKVESVGFAPFEQPVDVPTSSLRNLHLELTRLPSFYMKLLAPGGAPVTSGDIQVSILIANQDVQRPALGVWSSQHTRRDGIIEVFTPHSIHLANTGAIGISVRVDGIGAGWMFLKEWPMEPFTLQLMPGRILSGKVVDASGKPLTGVTVDLDGAEPNLGRRFLQSGWEETSGKDGAFKFPGMLPGRYDISFDAPHQDKRYHLISLDTDQTDVKLSPQDRPGPGFGFRELQGSDGEMRVPLLEPIADTSNPSTAVSGFTLANGKPVPGVALVLDALHGDYTDDTAVDVALSGADGAFTFHAPVPGTYQISTALPENTDYVLVDKRVTVPSGGLTGVEIRLATGTTLQLRLIGADGKPLTSGETHAMINVEGPNQNTGFGFNDNVGKDGLILVRAYRTIPVTTLTSINILVRHEKAGFVYLHLNHWLDGPVTLQLQKGGTIRGQVVDGDGKPVKDPTVEIYWLNEAAPDAGFQNFENFGPTTGNHFEMNQLPTGIYRIFAKLPDATQLSTIVHVSPGLNPFLTLRMAKGQTLTVQVTNAAGQPSPTASVQIFRMTIQQRVRTQFDKLNLTPPNGNIWKMAHLSPGTYFAAARLPNGDITSQLVNIVPGKDAAITLCSAPSKTVSIRVVDAAGKPLVAAAVKIFWISDDGAWWDMDVTPNEGDWWGLENHSDKTLDINGEYDFNAQHLGAYIVQITPAHGKPRFHIIYLDGKTSSFILRADDGQ